MGREWEKGGKIIVRWRSLGSRSFRVLDLVWYVFSFLHGGEGRGLMRRCRSLLL